MRRRRRRCTECKELFQADPRAGKRQRACSQEKCQKKRRQKTQRKWRERNPDYPRARRLLVRSVTARAADGGRGEGAPRRPAPLSVPAVLRCLPWDLAQDEIGVQITDFIAVCLCLVVRLVKDQMRQQVVDSS